MIGQRSAALVTAGAKRVGKVLALRLASRGFDIALHYNNSKSEAEATAKEIEGSGTKCELFQADLTDTEELQRLIPAVMERMPELKVLVNNASIWHGGKFLESSLEELAEFTKVHLEAPYILTRDFARLARHGLVVNIVDSNIVKHTSNNFAYLLSKKALYDFTMLAATELAPEIRVNAIAPGAVLVPEDERKEKYEQKFTQNPLERAGSPDDVADALDYLLSGDHISGQCIFVSGGKHLL